MEFSIESEIQLRQAILSLMAAAEHLGIHPELLRLTAIGVLTKEVPDWWVDIPLVEGSMRELNASVSSFVSCYSSNTANTG